MWHETAVQRVANAAGFEIRRLRGVANPSFQLALALGFFSVDTVIDVGANVGQFGAGLRKSGYKGRIVSFEPLAEAHRGLSRRANRDPEWQVHERSAVGDFDGETTINVSANSVSSSLLPMLDAHRAAAGASAYIGAERTPIVRLDTALPRYLRPGNRAFLKIDTQGSEAQVLDGLGQRAADLVGIQLELSLVRLYDGQRLWLETIERIEAAGFTLWMLQPGFTDPGNGRTLQLDAVFFRN